MTSKRWYRWDGSTLLLRIKVQPRSSSNDIVGVAGDALRVRLRAPPADGQANRALLALLATALSIPKRNVTIRHGHGSRTKTVAVAHSPATATALVTAICK